MTVQDKSDFIIATVAGKPLTEVPTDLFIPPDALEVLLDSFAGPLDLLLYLIRKQNLDILDIPIALITRQYMQYIHLMEEKRLELAADYLVMAALLAEIKSRMLLPIPVASEDEEEDPRAELVRKLQLYEQIKNAAFNLDQLPRSERDFYPVRLAVGGFARLTLHPDVELHQLEEAMLALFSVRQHQANHQISRELLSVRERMAFILERITQDNPIRLAAFYQRHEGRMGLAVSLLAILELARQSLLKILQTEAFATVYIQGVCDG